jgi:predicted Zn-dependent protease
MPEFKELMDLVTSRRNQIEVFGEPVKLVVYIVNNDTLPGLLSIPGQCSLINIRRMRFDRPSEDVFRKRLIKIAMKGLALAGGVAGNGDAQCVMYWKSFSVIGIDKTSATFSPMCFFVLQDTLDEIGTSEIFRPEY